MQRTTSPLEKNHLVLKVAFLRQQTMASFPLLFLLGMPRSGGVFHSLQRRDCAKDNRLISNLVFPKAWQNRNKIVFKS